MNRRPKSDTEPSRQELHEQVSEILERAFELSGAQREQFLKSACEADPEVRREVESLLEEMTKLGSRPPTFDVLRGFAEAMEEDPDVEPPPLPKAIAGYRILRLLGEGGMGVVYLAEQNEPVARRVALKVTQGSLRSSAALLRFEAERNALARLAHPHIAQLFEAGATEEGFPFFVMEHIPGGQPLTGYCDRGRLSLERRLRLFTQVCRGVHHAHQKGVLHLDLKPANVLVTSADGEARPKIIDFGLARAVSGLPLTDRTEATSLAAMGTPSYMSPEAQQGSPDVDTRSDVFSLGVMLYELLAGVRPPTDSTLPSSGPRSASRWSPPRRPSAHVSGLDTVKVNRLASGRSLRPRELASRLRGDLDWIVTKTIIPDPDRRYASAEELAKDIERHLRREPISAHPPSLAYRTTCFVRRNAKTVFAGSLLLLALIGGFIARSIEADRAQQEAERAREAQAQAEALADFLTELFEAADPERRGSFNDAAKVLLDHGVESLETKLEDQPRQRARLLLTVGRIYANRGLFQRAETAIRKALVLSEEAPDGDEAEVAAASNQLGIVLRRQGRTQEALPFQQRALEIYLRAEEPDLAAVASAHSHLGNLWWAMGRHREAEASHREALEIRLGLDDPPALSETFNNLAVAVREQERWEEARGLLLQAVELSTQALGADHPRTIASEFNLAYAEKKLGNWEKATALYRRSLERWEKRYGADHPRTILAFSSFCIHLESLHLWREAVAVSGRWVAAVEAPVSEGFREDAQRQRAVERARALRHHGYALGELRRHEEAAEVLGQGLETARRELGNDHLETILLLARRARVDAARNRWQEAEDGMSEALGIMEETSAADSREAARIRHELGWIVAQRDRPQEAEALLRQALARREDLLGKEHLAVADTLFELGRLLRRRGDPKGDGRIRRALEIRLGQLPPDHPLIAEAQEALAER